MTVLDLEIDEIGQVKNIDNDNEKLRNRLLSLGLVEGTEIKILHIAPLKDPIVINFRGTNLCIRKKDAKNIILR